MADLDNDPFSIDQLDDLQAPPQEEPQPLYQIYEGSRVAISKSVGKYWKNRLDAAMTAYSLMNTVWEQSFQYYNNNQSKALYTPRGIFKRGDSTENVVFSNLNIMLPAIYSRDPDITCTTTDEQDEPFCKTLEALLDAMFRRKTLLGAKSKVKKAAGMALLTNLGVLKVDWTLKEDSQENALSEMQQISDDLARASDLETVQALYGRIEALESNMEVMKPSGPSLSNVLPFNCIIDPYAEQDDAMDASWIAERVYYQTSGLIQRFTEKENPDESERNASRVYLYKPTHKAVFSSEGKGGTRDDGLGVVLEALHTSTVQIPVNYQEQERRAYVDMYYTECWLVWDKPMRRVMLFHRDDWSWPLWVWDDPLKITRFFPYFVFGFTFSTGGTVSPGETAYYLDQQDEINDINRKMAQIRRAVFDFVFYNSNAVKQDEAEKFVDAIRGKTPSGVRLVGVDAGETGDPSKMIAAFVPPSMQYEQLFDKKSIIDSINRITNTSDALRGVQFKTNTNVASVESYQQSMRLSVGAKVDVIEDVMADLAQAMAELCSMHLTQEDVAGLIGDRLAQSWTQMTPQQLNSQYSLEIVAGSMEKPNSEFRKKEAIQVSQAVGQFAQAAPGGTLKIMLQMLEQAFTDVAIKPEDWDMLNQEIAANMNKGLSQPAAPPGASQQPPVRPPATPPGQPPVAPSGSAPTTTGLGAEQQNFVALAQNLPVDDKAQVVQMAQSGAAPEEILKFIQQKTGAPNAQPTRH